MTSAEFDKVFKTNQVKLSTPEFLLLAVKNNVNQSRLGMVVSKKNTPHAVDRNQLKRLIRETFRKVDLPSIDVMVLTRTQANKQSKKILSSILENSFQKVTNKFNTETR